MPVPQPHSVLLVSRDYYARMSGTSGPGEPALLACIPIAISGEETASVDIVMRTKFEVVRVDCIKQNGAGAGNTMTLKNGATAITDDIDCETDKAVTGAGTIDDAQSVLNEGDTLRLTGTYADGTLDALVIVYGIVRA